MQNPERRSHPNAFVIFMRVMLSHFNCHTSCGRWGLETNPKMFSQKVLFVLLEDLKNENKRL